MRASIKSIWIDTLPLDPDYFCSLIDVVVGPVESQAGDNFSCTACSPSWFADHVLRTKRQNPTHEDVQHPPTFGRHFLFANVFDQQKLFAAVDHWVTSQEGNDWQELANRLSRNLAWEFEDYQEWRPEIDRPT